MSLSYHTYKIIFKNDQLSQNLYFKPNIQTANNKIYHYKMNSESPYYVTTNAGKLELMKGCYLTLMRRKNSAEKTLQKKKLITHSFRQSKKTIKKSYNIWKEKTYSSKNSKNEIVLITTKRNS